MSSAAGLAYAILVPTMTTLASNEPPPAPALAACRRLRAARTRYAVDRAPHSAGYEASNLWPPPPSGSCPRTSRVRLRFRGVLHEWNHRDVDADGVEDRGRPARQHRANRCQRPACYANPRRPLATRGRSDGALRRRRKRLSVEHIGGDVPLDDLAAYAHSNHWRRDRFENAANWVCCRPPKPGPCRWRGPG